MLEIVLSPSDYNASDKGCISERPESMKDGFYLENGDCHDCSL